jgi:GT2 family glycosyltransferase
MNQSVAVIVLCGRERDHWINPLLMKRVVQCIHDGIQAHRPVAIDLQYGTSPVELARNAVVKNFLQTSGSWLIQIDNDTIPPENFLTLVDAAEAEGKRVFGIPTPAISNDGLAWNVGMKMKGDDLRCNLFNSLPKGWNRCDYLGGAFLAVHRCVLEAIKGDWFNRTPTKSEDFAFSERARNAGFSIWFHGDSQCDHIHSASLLEMLKK